MMKKIDLHLHTTFSDGLYTPKQVLQLTEKFGFDIISITDHDNIGGYLKVKDLAHKYDIQIIAGVEVSSFHKNREVHILGYLYDYRNEALRNMLDKIYQSRYSRAKKIVSKLAEKGIDLDFEKIKSYSGENNYLGRPHICRALIDEGYCKNKYEAFDKYLGDSCFAYVPKYTPPVKKVIRTIQGAGGISVLAHPYTLRDDKVVFDVIKFGIDGIEVFYARCNDDLIFHYNEMAQMNNLIRTGGSDFHGDDIDLEILKTYSAPPYILDEMERGLK